ncbi:hypothetical protein MAR_ORF267 [Marseillevirus marseillevirus]|uniref:Uncharacterized protein n=2 Tax=Marseillevirus TaxID=1513458 RepID=D2XAR4_GBMV|nr:hypothetical protein MAR_ORF267 [Marseillevirus marseillevirus]ADB04041.1 hypothetical protein MAR_ORF267 [Marseillevirus marseillevirus]AVR52983.1 hypothetical protein MarSH_278 [Marseillevirus Shanghai 1]
MFGTPFSDGQVMKREDIDVQNVISKISIEPPEPIIFFSGIKNQIFSLPKFEGLKKILVSDSENFVLQCDQKLLTVSIIGCRNFSVKLSGVVGNVDVFRSHFGKIISETKVPFFQTELSSSIEYRTKAKETTHVVTTCREISQSDSGWSCDFGLNEWSERTFVMLDESPYTVWMMKTEQPYLLNQISQNLFGK